MRTVHNSSRLLVGVSTPPPSRHPSLRAGPPQEQAPPGSRHHPPPPRPAARHAGIPPVRHAGIPSPCGQTDTCKNIIFATSLRTVMTHACENITFPQLRLPAVITDSEKAITEENALFRTYCVQRLSLQHSNLFKCIRELSQTFFFIKYKRIISLIAIIFLRDHSLQQSFHEKTFLVNFRKRNGSETVTEINLFRIH